MPTRGQEDGPPFGARIHRRLNVVAGGERAPEAPRGGLSDGTGRGVDGRPPAGRVGGAERAAGEGEARGVPERGNGGVQRGPGNFSNCIEQSSSWNKWGQMAHRAHRNT